jgi:hypothetical protein
MSASHTTRIRVIPNQPPQMLRTSAAPAGGTAPLTVKLAASGSDPEHEPLDYSWDLDDGVARRGATLTHVFREPGRYKLRVVCSDPRGGTVAQTLLVRVEPNQTSALTAPAEPPPAELGLTSQLTRRTVGLRPNPANPSASVTLYLEHPAFVDVAVFDIRGRLVRRLHAGALDAGERTLTWNGRSEDGHRVESGLYLVHARVGGERHVLKLAITR